MKLNLEEGLEEKLIIKKARDELKTMGLITHWSGELMVALVSCGLYFLTDEKNLDHYIYSITVGLTVGVLMQIPALVLRGVACDKEESFILSEYFRQRSLKEYGLEKKMSQGFMRLHDYFGRNSERYDTIVRAYSSIRRVIKK